MVQRLVFSHNVVCGLPVQVLVCVDSCDSPSVQSHFVLVNVAPQTWDRLQTGICAHMSITKYSLLKTAVRSSLCLVGVLHLSACGA